jgi:hypothetical protein
MPILFLTTKAKRNRRSNIPKWNTLPMIASLVLMSKNYGNIWHTSGTDLLKIFSLNSFTGKSFYPSLSTISTLTEDQISLPPHSSASLKLSFWDLTSPHILGWIFATCTFWHLYQSGLFFETRVFKFYNLVNHLVTVVTETSCHQLVAKDHPDSFAGQAAVHTAEVVFKAKFCPKSNLGVS